MEERKPCPKCGMDPESRDASCAGCVAQEWQKENDITEEARDRFEKFLRHVESELGKIAGLRFPVKDVQPNAMAEALQGEIHAFLAGELGEIRAVEEPWTVKRDLLIARAALEEYRQGRNPEKAEQALTSLQSPWKTVPTHPEQVAQLFHEAYEDLAPHYGYETREASRKPWSEVPQQNRELMTATVRRVMAQLLAATEFVGPVALYQKEIHDLRNTVQRMRFELDEKAGEGFTIPKFVQQGGAPEGWPTEKVGAPSLQFVIWVGNRLNMGDFATYEQLVAELEKVFATHDAMEALKRTPLQVRAPEPIPQLVALRNVVEQCCDAAGFTPAFSSFLHTYLTEHFGPMTENLSAEFGRSSAGQAAMEVERAEAVASMAKDLEDLQVQLEWPSTVDLAEQLYKRGWKRW